MVEQHYKVAVECDLLSSDISAYVLKIDCCSASRGAVFTVTPQEPCYGLGALVNQRALGTNLWTELSFKSSKTNDLLLHNHQWWRPEASRLLLISQKSAIKS